MGDLIWLYECDFVYERVMFIPSENWDYIYEYEWEDINSDIKDML